MIIGGLQKTSTVDWPKNICSVVFIAGCNFRCPFCHNPELVLPEEIEKTEAVSENELLTALVERKRFIDGVCITGGEPLMAPDIVKLMRKIKDKGLKIKLDTNGSVPHLLKKVIEDKLVDYVAMDIKGPKHKYPEMTGVKPNMDLIEESIKILQKSGVKYEFRTTVVKGMVEPSDIKAIGKWLSGSDAYYLQHFISSEEMLDEELKDVKTYTPDEMREMMESVAGDFKETGVRGV